MKKRMISYLTALSILFGAQSFINTAKSEEKIPSNRIEIENEEYEVIPLTNPFNISEEESILDKPIKYSEQYYMTVIQNNERFILPVKGKYLYVVSDLEKNTEENKVLFEREKAILYSELVKIPFISKENARKYEYVDLYYDIKTDEAIYMETSYESEKYINEEYFKSIEIENLLNKKVLSPTDFGNAIEIFYGQTVEENDLGVTFDTYHDESTIRYFMETYKKIIPTKYWPVRKIVKLEEKLPLNINKTLPKLKDEILDEDIKPYYLCEIRTRKKIAFIISKKVKFSDGNGYIDINTGETIDKNGEVNKKYLKNIGIVKDNSFSIFTASFYNQAAETLKNYRNLKEIAPYFINIETLRDAVELYQLLPLEYQVDYSYFDFKKSPNVDQSSYVVNKSGNFIINEENMTIKPIIERPKVKELTKNS